MGGMLDTMGSFIIGGVVLLMLGGLMISMQDTTTHAVMNEISQVSLAEMSQTLERDMNNLGYRVSSMQKVLSISYRSIVFLTDTDNNGSVDTISYQLNRTTLGPEITRRIGRPGSTPQSWTSKGSMVFFTAYDSTGTLTTVATKVRAIETSMLTANTTASESDVANSRSVSMTTGVNGTTNLNQTEMLRANMDCETGAYWHKTIYPKNLAAVLPQ
jgi:hypothetical protein